MAKEKATITLDRAKAAAAQALMGASSTSEVIDIALDELIRSQRLRADIAAYQGVSATEDEVELAEFGDTSGLADNTDWEALYDDKRS
jgi:Bacterial antitoxin of type II TA system, VapB